MRTRLSSNEHNSIAAAMHIVALSAIARAKTWKPGELAFQGGTALHMAYGSDRTEAGIHPRRQVARHPPGAGAGLLGNYPNRHPV